MMRSPLLSLAGAAVLVLATAAGVTGAQAAAAPPATWQVLRSVSPDPNQVDDSLFAGVSMASASEGWAVGSFSNPDAVNEPLAEHWDGQAWQITAAPPLPTTGASGVLNGVDEVGPANVWAAGSFVLTAGGTRTLIENFTGKSWAVSQSPNPFTGPGADDELNAVGGTSASDLWAVGFDFDGTSISDGLFEHFNGTTWETAPAPSIPGIPDFAAVSAVSASDVWAVGSALSATDSTLAAHWNGQAWQLVTTPCLNGTKIVLAEDGCLQSDNELTGVTAVAANNVWVSGYEDETSSNFHVPYVLHWNGKTWTLIKTPSPATGQFGAGSSLFGITALSASDVWAVGHSENGDGTITTLTEQFNGSTWSVVASPNPGLLGTDTLLGVAAAGSSQLFAVGSDEQSGQCCLRTLALQDTSG
jgi:hypothetical protein